MHRYSVVFVLFLLSMITYIDRVCISSAKDPIARDLALSDQAMGSIFGAFALGYAIAQVPSGWLADRYGPRAALTFVVSVWSLLTALTGAAWSFLSLAVIRFLFGIGEAGAFPGSTRAFYNWLPVTERGRANGILFSGSRIGGAISFPLLAWMLQTWSWRMSFVILGVAGLLWAVFWWFWFRDHPPVPIRHEQQAAGTEIGLRDIFRTPGMLLAMTQYFASNFTFFIGLSWMLPYLKRQFSLSDPEAAAYAMAPLFFGATAQWISGFWVDWLYRSGLRHWSRRLPGIAGFLLSALGMFALPQMTTPLGAVACFTLAIFGGDLTISPSWAYCTDISGRNSGSVSAAMNTVGNIGSFVSANAFPYLFGLTGSAATYFVVAAILNGIAAACWLGMISWPPEKRQTVPV